MANARADTEQVVFSLIAGVVRWSGGTTLLRRGDRYGSGDRLVVERADLFSTANPKDAPRSTTPPAPVRSCWVCKQRFSVKQGHTRYCKPECRRQRERWLARMARVATRGPAADPARPRADCTPAEATGFRAAVEAHAAALMRFAAYIGGRCDPADSEWTGPPVPDSDILFAPPKRRALLVRARQQAARLSHLVNDARQFEEAVVRRERIAAAPRAPGVDREAALRELDDAVAGWASRLEGSDGV
jgi:hypothetical protein